MWGVRTNNKKNLARCCTVPGIESPRKASHSLWCLWWKQYSSIILRRTHCCKQPNTGLAGTRIYYTAGGQHLQKEAFWLWWHRHKIAPRDNPSQAHCKTEKFLLSIFLLYFPPQVSSLPTKRKHPEAGTSYPSVLLFPGGSHLSDGEPLVLVRPHLSGVWGSAWRWLLSLHVPGYVGALGLHSELFDCKHACSSKDVPQALTWCMLD